MILTPEEQALFLRGVEDDLGVPASPEGHYRGDYDTVIPSERISDAIWIGADRCGANGDVYAVLSLTITSPSGTRWVADLPVRAENVAREDETRVDTWEAGEDD
jgi:hypothetical protein